MAMKFCPIDTKHLFLFRCGALVRPLDFIISSAAVGIHRNQADTLKLRVHEYGGGKVKGRRLIAAVSKYSNPATDVVEAGDSEFLSTTGWKDFASNVSGEWDGFGAEFSIEGNPVELPESVVPEAYREWEVKVFDWQTQCPTLASPETYSFFYKSIKLLPTVGCEADAATQYSVNERHIGGSNIIAYESSGSFVAVWINEDNGSLELEHCLVNPRNKESRVRIIQALQVNKERKLVLQNFRIFCEQWYGPFRNGDQLGGCSIRDSAFASTEALKSSQVIGSWQGSHATASFQNSQLNTSFHEVKGEGLVKIVRDEHDLILLPKQLWCSYKEREGEFFFEAGWLVDRGQAITSKCIFSSNAQLKEIAIARETSLAEMEEKA
ncbi:uncharacterized protein LOC124928948 [Impatiens glandulifera]|uniref:uncharacterized protein LOC124928948 n=1 Tax=Impatiens glandulifera TaxID=253017 RepID=UPI001FB116A9|nr:uncharacterized protein LOC124928948 [Impatiens glandulifera]